MTNNAVPALSQIVLHEALREALSAVEFLLRTKQPSEGCLVPLLGPTRVGKKSVARHLLSNAGAANSLLPMEDVIYCSLPPNRAARTSTGPSWGRL